MDRTEKLKELYRSIIDKIEPLAIVKIVLNDIEDIGKINHNIDAHLFEVTECYNNYLEIILSPESKHIALNRLKSDFQLFGEESIRIFNWQRHSRKERVQTEILNKSVDMDFQSWFDICRVIEDFFFVLTFECATEDLVRLEFELIGAEPRAKKVKLKRKTDYARSTIALIFSLLEKHKFLNLAHGERIRFAKDIEPIIDCDAAYLSKNILSNQSEIKDISRASIDSAMNLIISCMNDLKELKTQYPQK